MAAYAHDSSFFSRRAIVLFAIILIHVLLGWVFATGLARKAIQMVAPPIQTDIIEEVEERDTPPPPPPARIRASPG